MDKLYWIVCEEGDLTLFEGRYQGRTRGAAMKFLKDRIERPNLSGVVFTITEIPVPLIREIVTEILGGLAAEIEMTTTESEPAPDVTPEPPAKPEAVESDGRVGNPGYGDDFWTEVKACWQECRCVRKTAAKFGISPNTVKSRARREGWRK